MTLINRLSRLLSADVHAVLDRLEDPTALTQQALREMEQTVIAGQQLLDQQTRSLHQMQRLHKDRQRADATIDEELDLLFAESTDNTLDKDARNRLARPLVRRRLHLQREMTSLLERIAYLNTCKEEQSQRVRNQQETLDALRQKAELFVAPESCITHPDSGTGDFSFSDAELEVALLREQRRRSQHE